MNQNFADYAKLYDAFNSGKDYQAEVEYLMELVKLHESHASKDILTLGCGTGRHEIKMAELGLQITGCDLSQEMVNIAKSSVQGHKNPPDFICGDARNLRLNRQFDVVFSLFHVMSYQTENQDISNVFATAASHLNDQGILIFDYWYGPGVLTDLPQKRSRETQLNGRIWRRDTTPTLHFDKNVVDVNFSFHENDHFMFSETHHMRYLFLPELINFAAQNGLEPLAHYGWMTTAPLLTAPWYGVSVFKKRNQ